MSSRNRLQNSRNTMLILSCECIVLDLRWGTEGGSKNSSQDPEKTRARDAHPIGEAFGSMWIVKFSPVVVWHSTRTSSLTAATIMPLYNVMATSQATTVSRPSRGMLCDVG